MQNFCTRPITLSSASPAASSSSSDIVCPSSRRRSCQRCARPTRVCICAHLPPSPVSTTWHVLVLQTRAESNASVGSARLLPLVLQHASVQVVGGTKSIESALPDTGECLLLYPGTGSVPVSRVTVGCAGDSGSDTDGARTLVVLDGSWEGVRRLLSKSERLNCMQRVRLPESATNAFPVLFIARRPPANIPGKFCESMQLRASYSLVRRSNCSRHFLRLCQFFLQARAQRLRPWLLRWIYSKQLLPHVLNVHPLGKRFEIRFEQQAMHKCSLSIGAAMNRSPLIGQESALDEGLEILPTRRKAKYVFGWPCWPVSLWRTSSTS
jgi:DTW domain-containing protein YfiP